MEGCYQVWRSGALLLSSQPHLDFYLACLRMYESWLPIYDSKRGSRVCYNLFYLCLSAREVGK